MRRRLRIASYAIESDSQISYSGAASLNAGRTGPPLQFKTEGVMKIFLKFALIAVLALCSAAAFAGEKQSININIHEDATIAGVKIPAGEYKMLIDREGLAVKFVLMSGGRKVVETNARFVELASFSAPNAVVVGAHANVTEIQISKLKGSVVFEQNAGTTLAAGGK
jgi:hypothetical protein